MGTLKGENPRTPQPQHSGAYIDGYNIVVAMSELDIVYELSVTTASHDEIKMLFFFLFFFGFKELESEEGCYSTDF